MSEWANAQLRLYDENDNLLFTTDQVLDGDGHLAWHEVGNGGQVYVPLYDTEAALNWYRTGRRVYVTVINTMANTTHIVCDIIIENVTIEERSLDSGDGQAKVLKIAGRDRSKVLTEIPVRLRHISKFRQGQPPTAITATTLQMNASDTATYPSPFFVGWTIELDDGNWSEVIGHSAGGLLTIDPPWQVNADDDPDDEEPDAPPPPPQKWDAYGAALTETTGNYTDLKLAFRGVQGSRFGWGLDPQGYQSTVTGSFLASNDFSIFKTLQNIAAQTGEYFVRTPGTKHIRWRRTVPPATHPQYGSMILLSVPTQPWPDSIWYAEILPGQKLVRDASELVTRVRPTGGGSGDEMLTLRDLPAGFAAAAGFTIDGEFLISDEAEGGPQEINKDLRFPAIAAASDNAGSRELAAQALYRAALLWLQEHHEERLILDCEVMTSIPLYPVSQVAVNLGQLTTEGSPIYVGMYILESRCILKREGYVTYQLKLSDKKAPILTDERVIAEAIRDTDTQVFTFSAPARNSRKLDKKSGGGGGSHPAATAGNAAIDVTEGQVVSLNLAGPSGLAIGAGGVMLADSVAGQGLTIANKTIGVGLNIDSGLVANANAIGMGAPGTLSTVTTNVVTGSTHSHAVMTTANAWSTPNTILRGDATGMFGGRYIWAETLEASLVKTPLIKTDSGAITIDPASGLFIVDGNLRFTGARIIFTDTGSLTLAPAASLIIDPPDNIMQINPDVTVRTQNATSGFLGTGWQVNYAGAGDFRSLYADSLRVITFTSDTARVRKGSFYVTPSAATLSREFVVPAAVGTTATLYVDDVPGQTGLPVLADDDWIMLNVVDRSGGGLTTGQVWGQVKSYADLPDDEQSWSFTLRQVSHAALHGLKVQRGDELLDFGVSGDGWLWLTTTDDLGSPYLGITTWQGANPYVAGNRTHQLRLGQLAGMSGMHEWGLQVGTGSNRIRFSNIRRELHGPRLSLYAGDGAALQVSAVQVLHYRTQTLSTALNPNVDHTAAGVVSTAANYYSTIDEGTGSPNHNDYVANAPNSSGVLFVGLSNPTWSGTTFGVDFRVALKTSGFVSGDTILLYGQIFQEDEKTPLCGEVLIYTATTNTTTTVTVPDSQRVSSATQTQWNNARLRLRWEYLVAENKEAIRLDPAVPSIAVGNPLPTGYLTGGAGFWTGRLSDGSAYALRIGHPTGPHLRWSGSNLIFANSNGESTINFGASGNGQIDGVLNIGTSGEIRQGTGTLPTDFSGLRLFNNGGRGHLGIYGSGNLSVFNQLNETVGQIHGYPAGGGLTNVAEFAISSTHGTQPRGISILADGGPVNTGQTAGILINSGFINRIAHLIGVTNRLTVDSSGIGVQGQIVSDLAAEHSNPSLILQDSGVVAHGMTAVAATRTFGDFKKVGASDGGLFISGYTEATMGLALAGYATNTNSTKGTTAIGTVTVSARQKSGTDAGAMGTNANLLVVRDDTNAVFIVDKEGDFHYLGGGAAYDEHDDVGLLRALSRELWPGTVDGVWDKFVTANRQNLVDAGILSDGGFVSGAAMNRLLTGAVWQLASRVMALETIIGRID